MPKQLKSLTAILHPPLRLSNPCTLEGQGRAEIDRLATQIAHETTAIRAGRHEPNLQRSGTGPTSNETKIAVFA